jgi:hypothetical protein
VLKKRKRKTPAEQLRLFPSFNPRQLPIFTAGPYSTGVVPTRPWLERKKRHGAR